MSRLVSTAAAWDVPTRRRAFRDVAATLAMSMADARLCYLHCQLLAWALFARYGRQALA